MRPSSFVVSFSASWAASCLLFCESAHANRRAAGLARSLQSAQDDMSKLDRELRYVREEAENAATDKRMAEAKATTAESAMSESSQRVHDLERRCKQAEQRAEISQVWWCALLA